MMMPGLRLPAVSGGAVETRKRETARLQLFPLRLRSHCDSDRDSDFKYHDAAASDSESLSLRLSSSLRPMGL
eukprot:2745267-Rhodomonas_salina.1